MLLNMRSLIYRKVRILFLSLGDFVFVSLGEWFRFNGARTILRVLNHSMGFRENGATEGGVSWGARYHSPKVIETSNTNYCPSKVVAYGNGWLYRRMVTVDLFSR